MTIECGQALYLPELNDRTLSPFYAASLGILVSESVNGLKDLEPAGLKVVGWPLSCTRLDTLPLPLPCYPLCLRPCQRHFGICSMIFSKTCGKNVGKGKRVLANEPFISFLIHASDGQSVQRTIPVSPSLLWMPETWDFRTDLCSFNYSLEASLSKAVEVFCGGGLFWEHCLVKPLERNGSMTKIPLQQRLLTYKESQDRDLHNWNCAAVQSHQLGPVQWLQTESPFKSPKGTLKTL